MMVFTAQAEAIMRGGRPAIRARITVHHGGKHVTGQASARTWGKAADAAYRRCLTGARAFGIDISTLKDTPPYKYLAP